MGDAVGMYINFTRPVGPHGGVVLDLVNANTVLQQSILSYTATLTDHSMANSVRQYIKNCQPNDDWIEYLDNLDILRNTNWRTSLDQLSDKTPAGNL